MTEPHTRRLDQRSLVRRQLRATARALLRPAAYAGTVRELAVIGAHLAAYPLGVSEPARQTEPSIEPDREPVHPALRADPTTAEIPVLLVHGYVHNRSAFLVLGRALRRAGFRYVHGLNYNPLRHDIPQLSRLLAIEADRVRAAAGSDQVMIVGHSMGGIVARHYAQVRAQPGTVDTVVTLGSPHLGTYTAWLGPGHAARDLHPRAAVVRHLQETARPTSTRWIAFYSELDLMVTPSSSGRLTHPALAATNVVLGDTGHLSLLRSGEVTRVVIDYLADRDRGTRARPRRGGRALRAVGADVAPTPWPA